MSDPTEAVTLPLLASLVERDHHDERARGQFILALKSWVTQDLTSRVRSDFDASIAPRLKPEGAGRSPRSRARALLHRRRLYRLWAKLTYEAQGMKWRHMDRVLHDNLASLQGAAERLFDRPERLGSLTLDPCLRAPPNIAKTEIHRQPRGFCFEYHDRDISAGALYNLGALMGPSVAAGRSVPGDGRSGGDALCEETRRRYPDLQPARILELGCGTGRNTPAYKVHFPDAAVTAVDCAGGLLRWAFAFAESRGVRVDFRQMDITRMPFADGTFDLVTSHIVGHETTRTGLAKMIAEAWRVLRPGGVMFHMDVPTQSSKVGLCDQILNEFQVRHNGEPFWMGWADADVGALMSAAEVPIKDQFVEYVTPPERGAPWFCYGARKLP